MANKTPETETIDPDVTQQAGVSVPGLDSLIGKIILVLSLFIAIFGIYYLMYQPVSPDRYDNIHLMFVFVIFFLTELYNVGEFSEWDLKETVSIGVLGIVITLGVAGTIYLEVYYETILTRFAGYPTHELMLGGFIIFAAIYSMYRAYGFVLAAVVITGLLYASYGYILTGIFYHGGQSWTRLIELNSYDLSGGVYHLIFHIGATWIFIFIVWAGILEEYGGLDTFLDIGFLIGSKFRSGVAQTAVISSMIMGSISGSPMANSAVTGSFTIPLMKDQGIPGRTAGGIEATASTGGMIMPPVMGSVAFLMANFLDYSYGQIIVIAAIPAIIFYIAIVVSVHLITIRLGVEATVERTVDRRQTLINAVPILASVFILIYTLLVLNYSPGIAGVYTIFGLIGAEFLFRGVTSSRNSALQETKGFIVDTLKGFRTGVVRMAPITITLAGIGVLITSISITGIGFRLSTAIVHYAGAATLLLLILVAVSSIVLGMGMPTVAAYLVSITLVAPAMVNVGFEEITAHFFVFYFAMLATITPPIALGPAVTCKIADSGFYKTSFSAVMIGAPLFLLPFVFAYNESLLLFNGLETVLVFFVVLVGYLIFVAGLHGGLSVLQGRGWKIKRGVTSLIGVGITFLPAILL